MKYLLIFLISFTFAVPAFAAKIVTGEVPQVQPLQPPQAGVQPNYQHNITGNPEQNFIASSSLDSSNVQNNPDSNMGQPAGQHGTANPSQAKSKSIFTWLIVLICVIGCGFIFYKLYINGPE